MLITIPSKPIYMTHKYNSPRDLIAAAEKQIPFLRAMSHIGWEPYRNIWVGTLLQHFITHLSTEQFSDQDLGKALELLSDYRTCFSQFSANARIPPRNNSNT
jgi:hypothetical protein